MTHKLAQDHYSNGKDKKLYGIKGDKVKIIHHGGNACIVENALGERFSILSELLELC